MILSAKTGRLQRIFKFFSMTLPVIEPKVLVTKNSNQQPNNNNIYFLILNFSISFFWGGGDFKLEF